MTDRVGRRGVPSGDSPARRGELPDDDPALSISPLGCHGSPSRPLRGRVEADQESTADPVPPHPFRGRRGSDDDRDDAPHAQPSRRGVEEHDGTQPLPDAGRRAAVPAGEGTPAYRHGLPTPVAEPTGSRRGIESPDDGRRAETVRPARSASQPMLTGFSGETPESYPTPVRFPQSVATPAAWTKNQDPLDIGPLPDPAPADAPIAAPVPPDATFPVEVPWTPAPLPVGDNEAAPVEPDRRRQRQPWYLVGALAMVAVLGVFVSVMANPGGTIGAAPGPSDGRTPGNDPTLIPSAVATPTPGASSSAAASPSAIASPSPTSDPSLIALDDDAQVRLLPGWQMYTDEVVQDDRRLIRIKQLATDTRIQIVTLTSVVGPLDAACSDLIAEHRPQYSGVVESPSVAVAVSEGSEGSACSFTGTRMSDNVASKVDFTIVRRADGVSLLFRDIAPQTLPVDAPALNELATIECGAAESFGVTIGQCAG